MQVKLHTGNYIHSNGKKIHHRKLMNSCLFLRGNFLLIPLKLALQTKNQFLIQSLKFDEGGPEGKRVLKLHLSIFWTKKK